VIGYLKGRIVERGEDGITLDVGGVGYELQCSLNTLDEVLARDEIQLWVQTYLREDAISLFGFASQLEKRMFLSLVKVNGVGPKMALKILSGARLERLAEMIEAGDVKALSNLPKVGKKTAEQLILSLKGKLVLAEPGEKEKSADGAQKGVTATTRDFSSPRAQVVSALVNLGFRFQDAEKAVEDLPVDVDLQQGVRQGLQVLTGQF